jgi:hypothetical protein
LFLQLHDVVEVLPITDENEKSSIKFLKKMFTGNNNKVEIPQNLGSNEIARVNPNPPCNFFTFTYIKVRSHLVLGTLVLSPL